MRPAFIIGTTLTAEAETMSRCPPSRLFMDSAEDLKGTTVSLPMSTPAAFSGLAIAVWMWLPMEVATPMDKAAGFFLRASTRSRPVRMGESARTATVMNSSNRMARGVKSS